MPGYWTQEYHFAAIKRISCTFVYKNDAKNVKYHVFLAHCKYF